MSRRARSGPRCSRRSTRRRCRSTSRKSIRRCRPRSPRGRRTRSRSSSSPNSIEVQKYLAETNHMWDGFWFLANGKMWNGLPADVRDIIQKNFNESAIVQREDIAKQNATFKADLTAKGMEFIAVDQKPFRAKLEAAGFYKEWRANTATKPGPCWRNTPARSRKRHALNPVMEIATQRGGRAGLLACVARGAARWLARPRGRSAGRVAHRDRSRDPVRGRGLALRLPQSVRLVGRTRLDPVSLARDARRRGGVPPRRAHAHVDAGRARCRRVGARSSRHSRWRSRSRSSR